MQYLLAPLAALCFVIAAVLVARVPRRPASTSPVARAKASMQRTPEERLLWAAAVALKCASAALDGEIKNRIDAIVRIAFRRAPLQDAMAAQLFAIMVEKASAEVETGPALPHLQSAIEHAEELAGLMRARVARRAEASRVA